MPKVDMDSNGRTHEPTLRELTGEMDGLRSLLLSRIDALKDVIDERDRLYKERDESRRTAVDAALTAVKEQTKQSFEASEKAIVKAEDAQKSYNTSHNDLARKMDEQNKATMPRSETESRFHALQERIDSGIRSVQEKIDELRNALSAGHGMEAGSKSFKDESRANVAIIVAVIGSLLALTARFWRP